MAAPSRTWKVAAIRSSSRPFKPPKPVPYPSQRTYRRRNQEKTTTWQAVNASNLNQSTSSISSLFDTSYDIDLCFPFVANERKPSIGDIIELLKIRGFPVQRSFNFKLTQYYYRCTLQVQNKNGIDLSIYLSIYYVIL